MQVITPSARKPAPRYSVVRVLKHTRANVEQFADCTRFFFWCIEDTKAAHKRTPIVCITIQQPNDLCAGIMREPT